MESYKDKPVIPFASQKEWEQWLAKNHEISDGIWIKFAKKATDIPSVYYDEALETSLRFGWIDSQVSSYDEQYYLQRFTPRRKRSNWSKINRAKAEELIEQGKMEPAGMREVEQAKADGRWEAAYAGPASIIVPDDFKQALKQNKTAAEYFDTLSSQNRYAILYNIEDAKKPETRARRIKKFIEMFNQQKLA